MADVSQCTGEPLGLTNIMFWCEYLKANNTIHELTFEGEMKKKGQNNSLFDCDTYLGKQEERLEKIMEKTA